MVFGIVGLLIPIFVLLYAVVYITLEKNMYHNAADSLEKLSVEAQIYTMNYLEKEAEVDTLGPNSLLIASYLARMDVRVQMMERMAMLLQIHRKEHCFTVISTLRVL